MKELALSFLFIGVVAFFIGFTIGFKSLITAVKNTKNQRGILFIWLMLYFGLSLWFKREYKPVAADSLDSSAILQIVTVLLAFSYAMLVMINKNSLAQLKGPLFFLFLYGLLGLVTLYISPTPLLAGFKSLAVITIALLGAASVSLMKTRNLHPAAILNVTYFYLTFLVLLTALGGLFFPEETHRANKGLFGFMLKGWPALNSNSLSLIAAVVSLLGVCRYFCSSKLTQKGLHLGVACLGISVLLLAQGRTSIVSFLIAVTLMAFIIREMRSFRYVLLTSLIIFTAYFLLTGEAGGWYDYTVDYLKRGNTDESLQSLSGRTEIWKSAIDYYWRSPFIGYGFYSAEHYGIAAHNSYVYVLMCSGMIGLILWLLFVYKAYFKIYTEYLKTYKHLVVGLENYYKECMGICILLFFRTITSMDLTTHNYSLTMFVIILVFIEILRTQLRRLNLVNSR